MNDKAAFDYTKSLIDDGVIRAIPNWPPQKFKGYISDPTQKIMDYIDELANKALLRYDIYARQTFPNVAFPHFHIPPGQAKEEFTESYMGGTITFRYVRSRNPRIRRGWSYKAQFMGRVKCMWCRGFFYGENLVAARDAAQKMLLDLRSKPMIL